jgi:putative ABC transport system permease protein
MDRRNLRRMIRYEAVMIAVFGAVLGLGTGVIFGWAFQRAEAGKGLHVLAIPVGRLGLYVLAAVVIGVIAAIWPARRAAKMDILRAISTE